MTLFGKLMAKILIMAVNWCRSTCRIQKVWVIHIPNNFDEDWLIL
jgi:hypothetical protein